MESEVQERKKRVGDGKRSVAFLFLHHLLPLISQRQFIKRLKRKERGTFPNALRHYCSSLFSLLPFSFFNFRGPFIVLLNPLSLSLSLQNHPLPLSLTIPHFFSLSLSLSLSLMAFRRQTISGFAKYHHYIPLFQTAL